MKISLVIGKYIDRQGLTLREFADALSINGNSVSHATIINWREGHTEPSTDFLVLLLIRHRDWRFDMALECLAARRPDVWGTEGAIWKIQPQ